MALAPVQWYEEVNLSIKTDRKLHIITKSQHTYNMPSTLVIGLVCGIQQIITGFPYKEEIKEGY